MAVNMQGTVFTLARLKIVPSYHQEHVTFNARGNFKLVQTKNNSNNLSLAVTDHVGRVCIQCSSLWTSKLQSFSSGLEDDHIPFLSLVRKTSSVHFRVTKVLHVPTTHVQLYLSKFFCPQLSSVAKFSL